MSFVNEMILFQTDGENEVLKLDKLWHATHLLDTTFDLFSVWKEEEILIPIL